MDKIPENVINKSLYKKARETVYPRYKRPSAYRSMALQKEYIRLGGKYTKKTKGLSRWRDEKWVSVKDYLDGKTVACGDDEIGNNACRPTKRIDSKTPITIQEVIKKFGKAKVRQIVNKKIKNMDKTVNWNNLTIK
tara:strand:+ start:2557 stop:2964 length:408 start_codon:yes stop_codon:yes gene_type:complete